VKGLGHCEHGDYLLNILVFAGYCNDQNDRFSYMFVNRRFPGITSFLVQLSKMTKFNAVIKVSKTTPPNKENYLK
jgi:hypothetical protein